MNLILRKSNDRGYFDHGWLKSYHSFSFGDYYDPNHMAFRSLRVINEDVIAPKGGFPMHPHRNMEILTLVLEGKLAHKDSMGNESIVHTNEIQLMHAGSGITHSEYNPSVTEATHLLQIWITPHTTGVKPGYEQKKLPETTDTWLPLVSQSGAQGALKIHQDAIVFLLSLTKEMSRHLPEKRYGWLQLISGEVEVNGKKLEAGDALAVEPNTQLTLIPKETAKLLFFDLI